MLKTNNIRHAFLILSALVLLSLFYSQLNKLSSMELFTSYGLFFFIGIIAAIIANSTGAGGGIVFLPAFIFLGLSSTEALATSFAIQCFGMTAGSLSWLANRDFNFAADSRNHINFGKLFILTAIASIAGLLLVQWLPIDPPIDIQRFFGIFSLLVAFSIYLKVYLISRSQFIGTPSIRALKYLLIILSAFIGGMITAWLSIGVGEILAVLLILMGYRVYFAVALAVCVSAITVISGIVFHIYQADVNLPVLLFAAPGALIGGTVARKLATSVDTKVLKLLMATWIAISAIVYLLK